MGLLPVQIEVSDRLCVIVGGGAVAFRKSHKLTSYGARVRVIAADIVATGWAPSTELFRREVSESDFEGAFLVVAATDDPQRNEWIAQKARSYGALVQKVDDPEGSDLTFPATLRRGALSVSFSTDGASPAFAAHLRDAALAMYGDAHAEFCSLAQGMRQRALRALPPHARGPLLRDLVKRGIPDLLIQGERDRAYSLAEALFDEALARSRASHAPPRAVLSSRAEPGRVYLVGAGPGDLGLITSKGIACLRIADTVFYDALVNPVLLERYCPQARHIGARKRKGHSDHTQDELNLLLVEHARRGETVVRLKGGDPFLFGRGSEEARALHDAGIPFEVVPGVSSAIAVPAYAGIAVTDRNWASSVGVYSAHRRGGLAATDDEWRRIAEGPDTLVILMGKTRLELVCRKLVEHGRLPSTPAALVVSGTLPAQRTIDGTLSDLPSRARGLLSDEALGGGPALIVVGEAVRTRGFLDWFSSSCDVAHEDGGEAW